MPLQFKHIIYFNGQLFWEKESGSLCGRSRNYQSLSMQGRCMRCLGAKWLVLFLLFCGPCQRGGIITEAYWRISTPASLGFIRAQCELFKANCLASHLHFGHLAHGCWQTYWLRLGNKLMTPLDVGRHTVSALPQLYELTGALLLVVCFWRWGENMARTNGGQGGNWGRLAFLLLHFQLGVLESAFDTRYTIKGLYPHSNHNHTFSFPFIYLVSNV